MWERRVRDGGGGEDIDDREQGLCGGKGQMRRRREGEKVVQEWKGPETRGTGHGADQIEKTYLSIFEGDLSHHGDAPLVQPLHQVGEGSHIPIVPGIHHLLWKGWSTQFQGRTVYGNFQG